MKWCGLLYYWRHDVFVIHSTFSTVVRCVPVWGASIPLSYSCCSSFLSAVRHDAFPISHVTEQLFFAVLPLFCYLPHSLLNDPHRICTWRHVYYSNILFHFYMHIVYVHVLYFIIYHFSECSVIKRKVKCY